MYTSGPYIFGQSGIVLIFSFLSRLPNAICMSSRPIDPYNKRYIINTKLNHTESMSPLLFTNGSSGTKQHQSTTDRSLQLPWPQTGAVALALGSCSELTCIKD